MEKIISISLVSLTILGGFLSCQKNTDTFGIEIPSDPEKGQVTITASIPDEGLTKVALTPQEGSPKTIKLEWEVGDIIIINTKEFEIKSLASITNEGKTATFTGTEQPTPEGGKYTVTYTKEPVGGFSNQSQVKDGTYDHLGYTVTLGNVTDYTNVTFSPTWASSNSATFTQSSVLWLRALLPNAVATNVKKVIFKASQNVFNGTNTFTVTLGTAGVQGDDNKLDVYATIPSGTVTSGAMDLLLQFQVDADHEYDKYTAYRQIANGVDFGTSQYIGINCSNITSYAGKDDDGTAAHPYLIGDQHQMQAISLTTTKKYYKLVDDVDMTDVTWTSLNGDDTKVVDLDGNNKCITGLNKPLFTYLDGKVSNLIITGATVSGGNYYGILVRTISKENCEISNVSVTSSTISGGSYIGGLIGRITATTSCNVTGCSTDVSVEGSDYFTGGLVGYVNKASITNCSATGNVTNTKDNYSHVGGLIGGIVNGTVDYCHYTTGTIASGAPKAGGLIGNIYGGTVTVSNSYFNGEVGSGHERIGGLIGNVEASSNLTVTDCYSSGSVVGNTSNYCGGFLGYIESTAIISVTRGYTNCSITGGKWSACVFSAGNSAKSYTNLTYNGFVGWNTSNRVAWCYGVSDPSDGNYMGKDGTIKSQAEALGGWDFKDVWTTDATPTLRPYVAP